MGICVVCLQWDRVKQVIDGPGSDIDSFIRLVRENGGQLSGKLLQEFPPLVQAPVGQQVVAAIDAVFSGQS